MNQDIHDLVIYTADTTVTAMSDSPSGAGAGAGAASAGHSGGGGGGGSGGGCPIDHNAREAWLKQAREQREQVLLQHHQSEPIPTARPSSTSWLGSITSYVPFSTSSSSSASSSLATPPPHHHTTTSSQQQPTLGTQREVSTIPRAATESPLADHPRPSAAAASHGTPPANMERDTGADPRTGNWIYPSERMFFDAMRRKGHDARENDMRVVVPIHNAVNERAWTEIKQWEQPYLSGTSCATPMLHSFSGDSTRLSPKARVNTLLGYAAPFDRHDWVVDRCGKRIEYLIDFYAGRDVGGNGKPTFYLDVRPKLNSWEGVKMRLLRGLGVN